MDINRNSVEGSELVEQTFKFWLNDNEHIRSPFPHYIHQRLKQEATEQFFTWIEGLQAEAKEELNDEMIGERFEEIIFEVAMTQVLTEDERITIQFPFLPRLEDAIFEDAENQKGKSMITSRKIMKEGDHTFMDTKLTKIGSDEVWETKFELPVTL